MTKNKDNIKTKITHFERAIFLSWYCRLADCKFCYMSLSKNKDIDPKKARRRVSSALAEAILSKQLGWKIEFLSGGYDCFTGKELLHIIKAIYNIYGEKLWLNLGTIRKDDLIAFKPYIKGYAGTVETVNWNLRKKICPSKKLEPILKTFKLCEELDLKKAITIIIGLGETLDDFKNLKDFIKKHNISRITFYALNPHPGTPFTKPPEKSYYCKWIRVTRQTFPKIHIIAGAWIDKTDYYSAVLKAGADSITKIPGIRKFGGKELKQIESEIKKADRKLKGTLTKIPKVNWQNLIDNLDPKTFSSNLKKEIMTKLDSYLKAMKKNSTKNTSAAN